MNLSDGDIEFILTIYDTSTNMMEGLGLGLAL